MHTRIRKARENIGYTREQFSELLEVSVSYMAEVERGRTGISVKMLIKICNLLGLSADYILFGEETDETKFMIDKIKRLDPKYLSLLNNIIKDLLAIEKQ
ncbi:MAG: helix-turn-helix transcriptional regulator [Clostridia bacterium]|nr:helix-turn-helix transcriptional regulator [Clostridia bacterium]